LYISHGSVIVAPLHKNVAGIYYEQATPQVLEGLPTAVQIGNAFRVAFDKFSIKDAQLHATKRSDWPAYRASGLHSMKAFEQTYRLVSCFGLNSSNAIVRAATAHPSCADIELSISFNPDLDAKAIGEHLIRLIEAVNAT
jgi:hypothetical protein